MTTRSTLGGRLRQAWMIRSTWVLGGLAEAGGLVGDAIIHWSARLGRANERRFRSYVQGRVDTGELEPRGIEGDDDGHA